MIKIKTLNDLEKFSDPAFIPILRKEAIKWVKHIEEDISEVRHAQDLAYNKPLMKVAVDRLDEVLEGQITWIKMFHNITEDDLK